MLFDVVLLRREGRRRLRSDVLCDAPMRGEVATQDTGARVGLVATLRAAGVELARMERVTVTRIASGSLMLAGVETVQDMRHQQEWWCRLPAGGPPRPYRSDQKSTLTRDPSVVAL